MLVELIIFAVVLSVCLGAMIIMVVLVGMNLLFSERGLKWYSKKCKDLTNALFEKEQQF